MIKTDEIHENAADTNHLETKLENKFALFGSAVQRAKDIAAGNPSILKGIANIDKMNPIEIALLEISGKHVNLASLEDKFMRSFAPKTFVEHGRDHPSIDFDEIHEILDPETENTEIEPSDMDSAYYIADVDNDETDQKSELLDTSQQ